MRFQATIIAFAASLALTGAQDLSGVPQCALPCLIKAVPSSGCSATDVKCQCTTGQAKLTESITSCIPNSGCSADDQAKLTPALLAICKAAGITVTAPSAAASAAASGASAAASGASSAASAASSVAASGTAAASGAPAEVSKAAAPANVAGLGAVAMGLAAFVL